MPLDQDQRQATRLRIRPIESRGEGRRKVAEVRLRPSWVARVGALDEHGEPLAAVEVSLDGEVAGITDLEGWLVVERPERPQRLELHAPGRAEVDNFLYDAGTGRFDDDRWSWLQVAMEPRE